ncbi:hypothetical protein FrEUN1fDRAFT_8025, partial [Parafrankia sp. EUN1f]
RLDADHRAKAAEILRAVLADQVDVLGTDAHEAVVATKEALARVCADPSPGPA